MSAIFISYRRQDAIAHARAVFERLRAELGVDQVFIDLEGLGPGEDFVEALDGHLAGCRIVLALIGPQWLDARDAQGRRRLDNDADFVRLELRTVLTSPGVRVVPVLIDGTEMPSEADLPADLHPLARRQGLSLRFREFDADMRHMTAHLRRMLGVAPAPAPILPAQAPQASVPKARPPWASAEGDDAFGHWAEFQIGAVVQRLRWIEPGDFWMGSPEDELDRDDDEGPRHQVRITHGFWLADTACTQALWAAVMGGANPAHFQDDLQNPVERVSHDDALTFLAKLRGQLAGRPEALLPTEAQWEYACRAGTETPFSLGANITSEQVNYHGTLSYADGAMGAFRERTVPAKALPANRWGLFQMHGNVWEWCADDLRTYPAGREITPMNDPCGLQESGPGAHRVIRGGSWFDGANEARSAYRDHFPCGDLSGNLGFRLALDS